MELDRHTDTMKEQFTCEFSKTFAEKQTINYWMYKPKVEFYHHYISLRTLTYGPETQEGFLIGSHWNLAGLQTL